MHIDFVDLRREAPDLMKLLDPMAFSLRSSGLRDKYRQSHFQWRQRPAVLERIWWQEDLAFVKLCEIGLGVKSYQERHFSLWPGIDQADNENLGYLVMSLKSFPVCKVESSAVHEIEWRMLLFGLKSYTSSLQSFNSWAVTYCLRFVASCLTQHHAVATVVHGNSNDMCVFVCLFSKKSLRLDAVNAVTRGQDEDGQNLTDRSHHPCSRLLVSGFRCEGDYRASLAQSTPMTCRLMLHMLFTPTMNVCEAWSLQVVQSWAPATSWKVQGRGTWEPTKTSAKQTLKCIWQVQDHLPFPWVSLGRASCVYVSVCVCVCHVSFGVFKMGAKYYIISPIWIENIFQKINDRGSGQRFQLWVNQPCFCCLRLYGTMPLTWHSSEHLDIPMMLTSKDKFNLFLHCGQTASHLCLWFVLHFKVYNMLVYPIHKNLTVGYPCNVYFVSDPWLHGFSVWQLKEQFMADTGLATHKAEHSWRWAPLICLLGEKDFGSDPLSVSNSFKIPCVFMCFHCTCLILRRSWQERNRCQTGVVWTVALPPWQIYCRMQQRRVGILELSSINLNDGYTRTWGSCTKHRQFHTKAFAANSQMFAI